jgi:heptosyltransferase-3
VPAHRFQRALVVRGGALGDFLLTLPVLRALRAASGHLQVLAYPQFAQLAREAGLVDAARSIEYGPLAAFFARGSVQDPALREYFASFDFVLSYLYDPDGIFADHLREAGVRHLVVGPHRPGGKIHAADELASPLVELGIPLVSRGEILAIEVEQANERLVAIHPGSGSKAKNWAPQNWLALIADILESTPRVRLAIVGGEADRDALDVLAPLRGNARVEFWENLPLGILAKRLAGASAYLGHDTGVSHLAAALGVPSLLLFGPTDPAVWAPRHGHVSVLRAPDNNLGSLARTSVLAAARRNFPAPLLASASGETDNPR